MLTNRGWAALALAAVVVGCESDSSGPENAQGVVAQVELNGARPELYIQDVTGTERTRVRFTGAADPIPGNSPLVPAFTDENLLALGPLQYSPDGSRIAMVATLAHDQSEVIVANADGSSPRVASINYLYVITDIDWSADGNKLAYGMGTQGPSRGVEIFTTELSTIEVRKVTTGAGLGVYSAEIRFSNDGRQIRYGRATEEVISPINNRISELHTVDLSTLANTVTASGLLGDINGVARDGSWVLLLRNVSVNGDGSFVRTLVKRELPSGRETEVGTRGRLQYAEVLPGDHEVLVVSELSSATNDYQYTIVDLSTGESRTLKGLTPKTIRLAVHPTVRR